SVSGVSYILAAEEYRWDAADDRHDGPPYDGHISAVLPAGNGAIDTIGRIVGIDHKGHLQPLGHRRAGGPGLDRDHADATMAKTIAQALQIGVQRRLARTIHRLALAAAIASHRT